MQKRLLLSIGLSMLKFFTTFDCHSQQTLLFGTVKMQDKVLQGRFEVTKDSLIRSIVYAPYGITPATFSKIRHDKNELSFQWKADTVIYHCRLIQQADAYKGRCSSPGKPPIDLQIRQFNKEDAWLQGDSLHAGPTDIAILERAISLLNNGKNWNRGDKRICDNGAYPYKWSLFCALHQASVDVDSEYRHLRPAMQAARQAIGEFTSGKQYAHLLQDFNNEAPSFDSILSVLNRAKQIIGEKMVSH